MAVVTKFLTNSDGKMLVDSTTGKPLSLTIDVVNGLSIRLAEREAVSTTYSTFASYSTTSQTYSNITNASEFAVGDVAILQWTITDRDNTAGIIFAEVSAVSSNSITAKGLGMSVKGDHGYDGAQIELQVADGQLQWKYDYQESWTNLIAMSELKGDAGDTPEIGDNGNWFVGGNDTGKPSRGANGAAATIAIGQVLTGEPGTNASVENVGTANAAILNITIPRGNPGTNGTNGTDGAPGQDGADGAAATIQIGEVVTGAAGTNAIVENTGTENAAILKFTIPRGATGTPGTNGQDGAPGADGKNGVTFKPSVDTNGDLSWSNDGGLPNPETVNVRGAQGEAATIQVGQVTTLPAGSQATVTNSGDENAAVFNFGIPTGATGADGTDGAAATIEVGEVTTGAAGTQASVTNSGTTSAAVFDFTIPKGADGASGVTDVTAGTPTEQDGYTVTPVTFNFEQGNSKTVNIQAKNGEGGGAGVQQNAIINRTASVNTADENSPDFVENDGDLWVKKITGYEAEANTLEATLPSARDGTSAATAPNGKVYVFGGVGGSYSDDIVEFDPVTRRVTTLGVTLPTTTISPSAATAQNGNIYVFGGHNNMLDNYLDDIVVFTPTTQRVTTLDASLPSARERTSAATAPNGKIYVFGGYSRNRNTGIISYFDEIIEFDPVTQAVTTLDVTLPIGRYGTSAATAPNGKIYVFGGSGRDTGIIRYFDKIIEFDPIAQTVTTLDASLPSGRYNTSAATAPNGKIYVFGGRGTGLSNYFDEIIEFDPVTQAVTLLGAILPSARQSTSAATASNGKIYVFGGSDSNYNDLDEIVEFDQPVVRYAYSSAVVLSQEEYTQFKNILKGIFAVGISAPNAEISGTLEAGNTTINGTLTATGDISAVGGATVGADLSVMGNASAQNVTASGAVNADSAEISGTLSAGNTTVNGTLSASGAITANGEIAAPSFNATT